MTQDEIAEFRSSVRRFLQDVLPEDMKERARTERHLSRDDMAFMQRMLFKQGWAAPSWPKEFGGTGWTPLQQYIFAEEMVYADAPMLSPFGIPMIGPVIYTFGNEAQKKKYLPRILSGDVAWCQGFSEPGSGSDLASLQLRATDGGDHYVLNGQKIWTSMAHFSDMMFCLVRTLAEGPKQQGITFLLIDMSTPGLTVIPIISIDHGHSLNEVFFSDVMVPKENRIGEEGRGWTYAKFLLEHERVSIAEIPQSKKRIARLWAWIRDGMVPSELATTYSLRIAQFETQLMALEELNLQMLTGSDSRVPGLPSILKVRGSEVVQGLNDLTIEMLGSDALPFLGHESLTVETEFLTQDARGRMEQLLYQRAATIYGGTSEVQRNILSRLMLRD